MLTRKLIFAPVKRTLTNNLASFRSVVDLSDEVSRALTDRRPLVALESTIITHGMPSPDNLSTALTVEEIVRGQGAVPATIAVLGGRIQVGMTGEQLEFLASRETSSPVKVSRRDLPFVLSHKLNGGTTVSATLLIARHMGINIFVTGGIGGVHRQGESTLDISADLREMGRQPIMVVSSGVKSILDIERTLEYLETEGVCVMSYGPSKNFPAFYSDVSGLTSPYHVTSPEEAAQVLYSTTTLSVGSGILLAVPVPKEFSIEHDMMEAAINLALEEADKKGVSGKEVTPFILNRISNITEGKSLESNIALIKNNAHIGSKIAVEYQKLTRPSQPNKSVRIAQEDKGKTVVIGGSVLDCVATLDTELKIIPTDAC